VTEPLLGTNIQQDGSRKRAIFVLCPEQAKHLRASRQRYFFVCATFFQIKTRIAKAMRARSFRQHHFNP